MYDPTIREFGFRFFPTVWGNFLCLESDRLQECLDFALGHRIQRISLNPYHGFTGRTLDFMTSCTWFTDVFLVQAVSSLEPLHQLASLGRLVLSNNGASTLDLAAFPLLRELRTDWTRKIAGLSECRSLETICLGGYKPKHADASELSEMANLETLELVDSNIRSLSGLPTDRLRTVELHGLRALESLLPLPAAQATLEQLHVSGSRSITDFACLRELSNLERLILTGCGTVKSLQFVQSLKRLLFLDFRDTTIEDGDLSFCWHVPTIDFTNKKHYSHRLQEFKARLNTHEGNGIAAVERPVHSATSMDESRFWNLIKSAGDGTPSTLAVKLTELQPAEIIAFQNVLLEKIASADTFPLLAAAFVINSYISDDCFLDFRAWLVSQGQARFESAVADPNSICDWLRVSDIDQIGHGELLSSALEAFRQYGTDDEFYALVDSHVDSTVATDWPERKADFQQLLPRVVQTYWHQQRIEELHDR